ncbi:hypothetical protein OnM2_054069 [Erysiphe neolycopersici]|uniref:Post-SET domain-containing protein n=1 Tax=Erysiphe neolycopersici TaxID=212602 RepID=A0A420HRL8_9PEZI|nr:hypothetical protein OnM2_054069 [Erysiphe neolycopersici]
MAPIAPHWVQPSHPKIQEVVFSTDHDAKNYSTKSFSRINLPPFAVFADLKFPPCEIIDERTYASVQVGKDLHMSLNSDLMFINHSCEPTIFFDISIQAIRSGPQGLKCGQELTFFYPSTEWSMVQAFDCHCGAINCLGRISGARDLDANLLAGKWLNTHIRELLEAEECKEQLQQC